MLPKSTLSIAFVLSLAFASLNGISAADSDSDSMTMSKETESAEIAVDNLMARITKLVPHVGELATSSSSTSESSESSLQIEETSSESESEAPAATESAEKDSEVSKRDFQDDADKVFAAPEPIEPVDKQVSDWWHGLFGKRDHEEGHVAEIVERRSRNAAPVGMVPVVPKKIVENSVSASVVPPVSASPSTSTSTYVTKDADTEVEIIPGPATTVTVPTGTSVIWPTFTSVPGVTSTPTFIGIGFDRPTPTFKPKIPTKKRNLQPVKKAVVDLRSHNPKKRALEGTRKVPVQFAKGSRLAQNATFSGPGISGVAGNGTVTVTFNTTEIGVTISNGTLVAAQPLAVTSVNLPAALSTPSSIPVPAAANVATIDADTAVDIVAPPAGIDTSINTAIIIPTGSVEDLLGAAKPTPKFTPKIPGAVAAKMAKVKRHLGRHKNSADDEAESTNVFDKMAKVKRHHLQAQKLSH